MIDTSSLRPESAIVVHPSDRLFQELGNNTYDYKDLLSELIDNAIASKRRDRVVNILFQVFVDGANIPVEFVVSDDASGIPADRLGLAVTACGTPSDYSG